MRKLGLIAAVAGGALIVLELAIRALSGHGSWVWLAGIALSAAGALLWGASRLGIGRVHPVTGGLQPVPGPDTARLLDNFEQRFAELKTRKASSTVLGDLYTLAIQLEQRGRSPQATAVFRHLARIDGSYRDVAARLKRLMDGDRQPPRKAATDPARPNAATAPA